MPVKTLNEHQSTVLILEMLHQRAGQDHPEHTAAEPEFFQIFHPVIFDYARELEDLDMGTLTGNAASGASFEPSDDAKDWLLAQPLTDREIFLLTYATGGDFEAAMPGERDPQDPYPEFISAAFTLDVRGYGVFNAASTFKQVDTYFEINDAGRKALAST